MRVIHFVTPASVPYPLDMQPQEHKVEIILFGFPSNHTTEYIHFSCLPQPLVMYAVALEYAALHYYFLTIATYTPAYCISLNLLPHQDSTLLRRSIIS